MCYRRAVPFTDSTLTPIDVALPDNCHEPEYRIRIQTQTVRFECLLNGNEMIGYEGGVAVTEKLTVGPYTSHTS